jgi:hypothetical protein
MTNTETLTYELDQKRGTGYKKRVIKGMNLIKVPYVHVGNNATYTLKKWQMRLIGKSCPKIKSGAWYIGPSPDCQQTPKVTIVSIAPGLEESNQAF